MHAIKRTSTSNLILLGCSLLDMVALCVSMTPGTEKAAAVRLFVGCVLCCMWLGSAI